MSATATLSLATLAYGAEDAQSPDSAVEAEKDAQDAPEAVTLAGTEVAGSQVEGEASISTSEGISASSSATSAGLRGTFGIGGIRTISGLNGINARYFVTDKVSVGLNVGLSTFTYAENDPASTDMCPGADCRFEDTRTVAAWGMGLEGIYFLAQGQPAGQLPFMADFGIGGRFTYLQQINDADVEDNLDDATELDIEIPMVLQLRFGQHFVISPEFGVRFIIVPGTREDGDINTGTAFPDRPETNAPFPTGPSTGVGGGFASGPGFGFQITDHAGLFGGASLHYYF